jgi:prophage antirepressor-like protein
MNEIQVFTSSDFGKVRTININSEPWFVGKDVAEILGYLEPHKAISRHVDLDDGMKHPIPTSSGIQDTWIINESGLYSLIISSKMPNARQFKKWVTSEVLPSIRKHGAYMTPTTIDEMINNPDLLIGLATKLKEEQHKSAMQQKVIIHQQEVIEINKPKAQAFDHFINGTNYQTMAVAAKSLGLGRNTLFKRLKEIKILLSNNTPYQKYIDRGYFVVKEKSIKMGDEFMNKPQTYVTARGVEFIRKLLEEANNETETKAI